jgi:alpha-L-fucosidase
MPPEKFSYGGFNYWFATYNASGNDNVRTEGQEIHVPRGKYFSYQMLASAESGMASGSVMAKYADGSTTSGPLLVPAWWSWPYPAGGDLVFTNYLTNSTPNYNRSNIFQTINWLDSSKDLVSLTLPNSTAGSSTAPGGASIDTALHVFSLSMLPVPKKEQHSVSLQIQYARSTQKWMEGTDKTQIVEVLVNNVGTSFVLRNNAVRVHVQSPHLETVSEGIIKRLGPGDQAIVEVGVRNRPGVQAGSAGPAIVVIGGHRVACSPYTFEATYGIKPYEATYESVYSHESPNWFNNAKFGIFIHWGVYSVPGWGNKGSREAYAEWSDLFLQSIYPSLMIETGTGGISTKDPAFPPKLISTTLRPMDRMLFTTTSSRTSLPTHGILRSGWTCSPMLEPTISFKSASITMDLHFSPRDQTYRREHRWI